MRSLLNGIGGGFGRALGRIFAYFLIGFIIYLIIDETGFDIKSIFPKISIGGLL